MTLYVAHHAQYNGDYFEYYKIARETNSDIIACLFIDIEENMWIGTYAGLYRYRGNSFINYSDIDGLNSNFIFPNSVSTQMRVLVGS